MGSKKAVRTNLWIRLIQVLEKLMYWLKEAIEVRAGLSLFLVFEDIALGNIQAWSKKSLTSCRLKTFDGR